MAQTWFENHPDNDPTRNCTHLICPTCGCPNISLVGYDFTTQDDDPDLEPDHELTVEFTGACGHLWMLFLGDFGDEVMLDIQAERAPLHPRKVRRTSTDRHWK